MKSLFACLALAACASQPTPPASPAILAAWTELGPGGQSVVRVATAGACPTLDAGGFQVPMHARQAPSKEFPENICEAAPPSGTANFRVGDLALPSPPARVNRVLVLGDTGCRLKQGKDGKVVVQNCNDPNDWPFAVVAKSAAAWKPDLVIHVGDYHYREADCPAGNAGCAGSITGDNWGSWRQDFFTPAAPLLAAAPWVFVRGNHENCNRAGRGWFLLLDPRKVPLRCTGSSAAYTVDTDDHRLTVIDSGEAENLAPSLAAVAPSARGKIAWLLLHRPFLTPGSDFETAPVRLPKALSAPGALGAVFSGHRHILSLNHFSDERPPELITGNGGDALEAPEKARGVAPDSPHFESFGFLTLERGAKRDEWTMQEHDRNGKVVIQCQLSEKAGRKTKLRCLPPGAPKG